MDKRTGRTAVEGGAMVRIMLAVCVLLPLTAAGLVTDGGGRSLYVYYPSRLRPAAMQEMLHRAHPDLQVRVFGRYTDFATAVRVDGPAAVLGPPPAVEPLEGYAVAARGSNRGRTSEDYVLLTTDGSGDPGAYAGKTVGAVGIAGHSAMMRLIAGFFPSAPRLKRVTKANDLLPLLLFGMASGVVVPQRLVPYLRSESKMELSVVPLPGAEVGIVALGVRNGSAPKPFLAAVKNLPDGLFEELGVTAWQ